MNRFYETIPYFIFPDTHIGRFKFNPINIIIQMYILKTSSCAEFVQYWIHQCMNSTLLVKRPCITSNAYIVHGTGL